MFIDYTFEKILQSKHASSDLKLNQKILLVSGGWQAVILFFFFFIEGIIL